MLSGCLMHGVIICTHIHTDWQVPWRCFRGRSTRWRLAWRNCALWKSSGFTEKRKRGERQCTLFPASKSSAPLPGTSRFITSAAETCRAIKNVSTGENDTENNISPWTNSHLQEREEQNEIDLGQGSAIFTLWQEWKRGCAGQKTSAFIGSYCYLTTYPKYLYPQYPLSRNELHKMVLNHFSLEPFSQFNDISFE